MGPNSPDQPRFNIRPKMLKKLVNQFTACTLDSAPSGIRAESGILSARG
jgi:hypothetical protein